MNVVTADYIKCCEKWL